MYIIFLSLNTFIYILFMDTSTVSSIIQAISSVVALFISLFVPYNMDKKLRQRQKELDNQNEKSMKLALLPLLYELRFKSLDFIDENQPERKDIYGESLEISDEQFESDFWELIPKLTNALLPNFFISSLQDKLQKLAGELFIIRDMLAQNSKLQRYGYHHAWANHKDLFLEKAKKIHNIADDIISIIENENNIKNYYDEIKIEN